jgi:hypothetical protein
MTTKKKLKAGDWYTDTLSQPCVMVADGTGYGKTLAVVIGKDEQAMADARLMAEAPKLLEALVRVLMWQPQSTEAACEQDYAFARKVVMRARKGTGSFAAVTGDKEKT